VHKERRLKSWNGYNKVPLLKLQYYKSPIKAKERNGLYIISFLTFFAQPPIPVAFLVSRQNSKCTAYNFFSRSFVLIQKNQKIKDHIIAPRIGPGQRHTLRSQFK